MSRFARRARRIARRIARASGPALLALALPSAACHLFEPSAETNEADQTSKTDPAAYTEEVDTKLRRYSACRDIVASLINESWERYSDQVSADGKPKRRREGVYLRGISNNSFRSCRRVAQASKAGAAMPIIDETSAELLDAASRYAELTRLLDQYIGARGWKDDNWAQLAAIDPQLRDAHQRWASADQVLQQALDLRHIENDQLLLGVLEQRAGALEFTSREVMVYARPLVRCLEREPTPTAADCRRYFDEFDAVQGRFEEVYEQSAGGDRVFWMSTFAIDVAEFHEVAGDAVRKLGLKKLRAGDLQGLRDAYSSLVRDAETLDFDFP